MSALFNNQRRTGRTNAISRFKGDIMYDHLSGKDDPYELMLDTPIAPKIRIGHKATEDEMIDYALLIENTVQAFAKKYRMQ